MEKSEIIVIWVSFSGFLELFYNILKPRVPSYLGILLPKNHFVRA